MKRLLLLSLTLPGCVLLRVPEMTSADAGGQSTVDAGMFAYDSGMTEMDASEPDASRPDSGPAYDDAGMGCESLTQITCEACAQSGATCDTERGTCCGLATDAGVMETDASQLENDAGYNPDGGGLTDASENGWPDGSIVIDGGSGCYPTGLLWSGGNVACQFIQTTCAEQGGVCSTDPNMSAYCCCQAGTPCLFAPDGGQ